MNINTFYTLLDIPAQATGAEIDAAYQRQRERYSAERIAALGDEFRAIAVTRIAELEQAYVVLSDPERRRAYDAGIHVAPASPDGGAPEARRQRKSSLSRRELLMGGGGALLGLLVIAVVWVLAGR